MTQSDKDGNTVVSLEENTVRHNIDNVATDSNPSEGNSGITPVFRNEADALLHGGAGPKKCRPLLKQRHQNNPMMLSLLPDETQLKNRNASLEQNKARYVHKDLHLYLQILLSL